MKKWQVRVVHCTEQGDIEIDYLVHDTADAFTIIQQGPGVRSIRSIEITRTSDDDLVPVETLYREASGEIA